MGRYICTWNQMVRIIESNQIDVSIKLEIKANNGFEFLGKVLKICEDLNGQIIAKSKI